MAKESDLAARAAESTTALNPLVGFNRKELIGAVAMLLRRTGTSPIATAKLVGRVGKDSVDIVMGKSAYKPDAKDKRFQDPAWSFNPFYRAGLQYWMAVQSGLDQWVEDLEMDELEHARAKFVLGMITEAAAPTNSLVGNPMAIKRAIDSGGLSLVKGLKNAYDDLTKNGAMPSQVDKRPFKVGGNLATSPGQVVWRNEMLELIQYQPITEQVHEIPFLSIPPQINKFYVSDLTPDKSIVRFLLSQGFQTFIISWRNPTKEHREWGLTDYIDSLIQAMEVIARITKCKKINISGACSGGITTATLASTLAAAGDDRINSLTLQVCVLDPQREDSELGQIVSERSLEIARSISAKKGILEGDSLARMFAWMRPNDLVWSYVINNYLLGQDPPPFDVLFWNNDTTNLPAKLHSDYLDMSMSQPFANPGTVEYADHLVDLTKVTMDTFMVAGVTDHITPWKACYRTTQMLGSENVEFILSSSGHIQSLINPPGNPKAKYYRGPHRKGSADEWLKTAEEQSGSWWTLWASWLKERSGALKTSPKSLGSKPFPPLAPSPGTYVHD
jgi:polyhydroxyalkanoate synthase subunit PhaC